MVCAIVRHCAHSAGCDLCIGSMDLSQACLCVFSVAFGSCSMANEKKKNCFESRSKLICHRAFQIEHFLNKKFPIRIESFFSLLGMQISSKNDEMRCNSINDKQVCKLQRSTLISMVSSNSQIFVQNLAAP